MSNATHFKSSSNSNNPATLVYIDKTGISQNYALYVRDAVGSVYGAYFDARINANREVFMNSSSNYAQGMIFNSANNTL